MNYAHLNEVYDEYLEHYGVKGMEWGKKKKIKDTRSSAFSGLTQPFASQVKKAASYNVPSAASSMVRGAASATAASVTPKVQAKSESLIANRTRRAEIQKGAAGGVSSTVTPKVQAKVNTMLTNKARQNDTQKGVASGVSKSVASKATSVIQEATRRAQLKFRTKSFQKGVSSGAAAQTAKNFSKVLTLTKKVKVGAASSKTVSTGQSALKKLLSKKKVLTIEG